MFHLLLGGVTALVTTAAMIPLLVRFAEQHGLLDQPNERSAHRAPTPSLGGIGIFAGLLGGVLLWTPREAFGTLQYVLGGFLLVFLIGVLDDLFALSPRKKLIGQVVAAGLLAVKGQASLSSLYGFMGLYEIPALILAPLSMFILIGLINAFNLIDGINTLAGGIGLVACLFWGCWFHAAEQLGLSMIAFAMAGALTAFLFFNYTPARIFMGDTGSMLVGAVCGVLALEFIECNHRLPTASPWRFNSGPAMAIAVLIVPIVDTLNAILRRMASGRSPFAPDKIHLHHQLLQLGHSHVRASGIMLGATLLFMALCWHFQRIGWISLLLIQTMAATTAVILLHRVVKSNTNC